MKFPSPRKALSASGLISEVRSCFATIEDTTHGNIPLVDHLMSGLAIFGLKYPSLLQFDKESREETTRFNLEKLYGIQRVPSDTYLRERIDEVDPRELRLPYKRVFQSLQRGKALEKFTYLDGHYLLSLDGTGYFSSKTIHCEQCGEKHHKNGTITYHHQMLGASIIHPNLKEVIPLAPEPIIKQDGIEKNDCERNAAKRFLDDLRREHPHLKLIVIEDSLASNAPHIRQLQSLNLRFILGAKQTDHKFLFDHVTRSQHTELYEFTDENGVYHKFRYLNDVPLNESNSDLKINFLEYWETSPKGKEQHFSWVTDIQIDTSNLMLLMRGARARWKIENETFNTLKNQGYNFEHNFGHGYKNLSTVFMHLMMLAFLIDQVQQLCCGLYQTALQTVGTKSRLWRKIRSRFDLFFVPSWEALSRAVILPISSELIYDTS
jgi:hypothetical protein